uniref:Uncharacterized protein n=1 Tax=Anguilla anguilla TaxID=7936 RepID=A0A0E9SFB7_ANGAN
MTGTEGSDCWAERGSDGCWLVLGSDVQQALVQSHWLIKASTPVERADRQETTGYRPSRTFWSA